MNSMHSYMHMNSMHFILYYSYFQLHICTYIDEYV